MQIYPGYGSHWWNPVQNSFSALLLTCFIRIGTKEQKNACSGLFVRLFQTWKLCVQVCGVANINCLKISWRSFFDCAQKVFFDFGPMLLLSSPHGSAEHGCCRLFLWMYTSLEGFQITVSRAPVDKEVACFLRRLDFLVLVKWPFYRHIRLISPFHNFLGVKSLFDSWASFTQISGLIIRQTESPSLPDPFFSPTPPWIFLPCQISGFLFM